MDKANNVKYKPQQGFTLIELSIVLVIIGLIVGGVLVGQDLIRAAEIRATVSQLEKYNSAINTFRTKYNAIPGDIPAASATNFGFLPASRNGGTGQGDGNGLIEGGASGATNACDEVVFFWQDLSTANLIDGSFTSAAQETPTTGCTTVSTAVAAGNTNKFFPPAKLGRGNYVDVFSATGFNYFEITGISSVTTATGAIVTAAAMTPTEAFNMDTKLDDGLPLTGIVQDVDGTTVNATPATAAASGTCVSNATGSPYSTATSATSRLCQLRFRFN